MWRWQPRSNDGVLGSGACTQGSDQEKCSEATQEFSKIYNQRTEFMNEDRTGFVWLYLQK